MRHQSLQNNAVFLLVSAVAFQSVPAVAGISVFETFFLIAALLLMLGLVGSGGRMRLRLNSVTSWLFLTILIFVFSGIITETPRYLMTMIFALSSSVLGLLSYDAELRAAVRGALLSGLVLASTAIGQRYGIVPVFDFSKVSFQASELSGYTGLIPNRGSFGIILMTSLSFFLLILAQTGSRIIRVMAFGGIAINGIAVMVALSRSTMAAYVIVLAVFLGGHLSSKWCSLGYGRYLRSSYLILPALSLLFLWLYLSDYLTNFVEWLINWRPSSVAIRMASLSGGLEQLTNNPLVGTGSRVTEAIGHAIHNSYLAVLVERGVFGFMSFFMLNFSAFFMLLRRYLATRSDRRHVYLAVLAGFLGVQTEMMFFRGYLSVPYWVFIAILLIVLNRGVIPRREERYEYLGSNQK